MKRPTAPMGHRSSVGPLRIDTEADRTFLAQAMLRVGGAFDWRD